MDGSNNTWHSASAAGPDGFKMSAPRESDELGIIEEVGDRHNTDTERSSKDIYGKSDMGQLDIRKDVVFEIRRN